MNDNVYVKFLDIFKTKWDDFYYVTVALGELRSKLKPIPWFL